MTKKLKVVGDNIVVKATRKASIILVPEKDSPANRRKWLIQNTVIYDHGPGVKGYKKGQTVVLDTRTPIIIVEVDQLLGRERERKVVTNDKDSKTTVDEETMYFAVKEEHIIAVVN